MTLQQRADAYAAKFPGRPPLQLVTEGVGKNRHDVLYGQWLIGNDYRNKTRYYGAYPAGYLDRVMALFPDVDGSANPSDVLHVFSGSLPPGPYERCDIAQEAELRCSVYDLPAIILNWKPRLVLADPPYSSEDAKKYDTPMVNRGRVFQALAQVTRAGGHVVWLDTTWPMHRKDQWRTVGRIGLTRSTNHRVRMVTIFQRVSA